jgi:hypothetical protein
MSENQAKERLWELEEKSSAKAVIDYERSYEEIKFLQKALVTVKKSRSLDRPHGTTLDDASAISFGQIY